MASLSKIPPRGKKGAATWRIQFIDGAGERLSIYLGSVPRKAAEAWKTRVEHLVASLVTGVAWDTDLACWVRDLPDVSHRKLANVGLVEPREPDPRDGLVLATLIRTFIERSTVKPVTIRSFKQTLDCLTAFFGADKPIRTITPEDADRWRAWIVQDREGSGNRRKKRTTADNRLSPPTVAKRISVAKQLFRCAVRWEWLDRNPFDGLRRGSQANPARARYVSMETIRDVINACPRAEWRLLIALCRMAGLRCPSEIGSLTWASVNWEKGRLTVLAKKTEHHGGDHAVRVVPICPELRALLAEAFEQAEPGVTSIVPMAARATVNLRTHLERIIVRSGHEPWPRLLQNLRASCETDWVERFPAHVVAKWLGHSPAVAAQHYLMAREHHFDEVVGGGEVRPASAEARAADRETTEPEQGEATENVRADCISSSVQNADQQATADGGIEWHEMTEPADTHRLAADFAAFPLVQKTGVMSEEGLEPPTPSV
jgi:integrase